MTSLGRRKSTVKVGRTYEQTVHDRVGGTHIGGPGNPDIVKSRGLFGILGNDNIEVKAHKNPLTKREVIDEIRKGRTWIESKSGYTEEAVEYIQRYHPNVKLFDRGQQIETSSWSLFG